MKYKVHPDLKPLSANLQRLGIGEYFFGRDFKLELEENDFDELWDIANNKRNELESVINLISIDFNIYAENFIICLDIIYRDFINNHYNNIFDATRDFCDLILLGFLFYLDKVKKEEDFNRFLLSLENIEILDEKTKKIIKKAISNKNFTKIDNDLNLRDKISGNSKHHKKYQIFISSTFTDLIEERQAAVEAILKKGHIPAGMELFTAGDKSQWEVIKKWIDDSDIYLLILGGRYGSIDKETGLSYTEMEYNYAVEIGKPLFTLILSDNVINNKTIEIIRDYDTKDSKYILFKENVTKKLCSFPDNLDQIKNEINHSLDTLINDNREKMHGWIKGNKQ